MYKNTLIIPNRSSMLNVHFKDASVDEIVDFVGTHIEGIWRTYIAFHKYSGKHQNLKNKFKIYMKGYDNHTLDNSIPLQHGDIIVMFMPNDLPDDFYRSLEFAFAGIRYNAKLPHAKETTEKSKDE